MAGLVLPLMVLHTAWARQEEPRESAGLGQDELKYVVRPGDTLSAIAVAYGVTVEALAEWNGLPDPDMIFIGQRLRIGAPYLARGIYVVQPGDTLSAIARAVGVSVEQLVTWNRIADPDVILAGQTLRISGVRATPAQAISAGAGPVIEKKLSENRWPGRPYGPPIAIVLHTAHGSLEAMDAWFLDDRSEHSAHFGIGLDGRVHQYVELKDRAWANGLLEAGHTWPGPPWLNPNHATISIETEDLGDPTQPVTDAQYQATLAAARIALKQYPTIRYLVGHRAIAPESRASDPGARWIRSGRFASLAAELGLEPVP